MGFGILFFGYLISFLLSMAGYSYAFALVGYYLMFEGFMRLKHYNVKFLHCMYWLVPLFVCSLYTAAGEVSAMLTTESLVIFSETAKNVVSYIEAALVLMFNMFLGAALYDIGKEVGVEGARSRGRTLMVFIGVFYIAYIPLQMFEDSLGENLGYFYLAFMVLRLAWAITGGAAIFACYRGICDESDKDMTEKPSRFAFINKLREENERRREAADEKYRREREEKLKKKQKK